MLTRIEARHLYDQIGARQDAQAFYAGPALDALVRRVPFAQVQSVVEVGCGTGRLAERLLRDELPEKARYRGLDLSATMVRLARNRLRPFPDRATIVHTDGSMAVDQPDCSQDLVLATYLLDLLPASEIQAFLDETHRLLQPDGTLALIGLTWGQTCIGRLVSTLWTQLHRYRPTWVGGCRPLDLRTRLDPTHWRVAHHAVVRVWGVPSEVLVVKPR
jgi:SAM-dependent methyltransferase